MGLFICRSVTQNSPDLLEIKTKMLWYLFDLERSRSNQGRKDCENGEIVSVRNSAANSPIYFKYRPQYSSLSGSVCLLGGGKVICVPVALPASTLANTPAEGNQRFHLQTESSWIPVTKPGRPPPITPTWAFKP